jgi:hypothetical protein
VIATTNGDIRNRVRRGKGVEVEGMWGLKLTLRIRHGCRSRASKWEDRVLQWTNPSGNEERDCVVHKACVRDGRSDAGFEVRGNLSFI